MALVKCPECGRDISDKAKTCIHCGYPISRMNEQRTFNEVPEQPFVKQTKRVEESVEFGHQHSTKNTKTKKIVITVAATVAIILLLTGITSGIKAKLARERDLSDVFDFSFSWTMQDVIEYEAEEFGNTEYRYDADVNRLDFEPYNNESYWKHSYFFDKETGNLKAVDYSGALSDYGGNPECEHVKPLRKKLLNLIGDWDEKATGKKVRSVAYGQIDGVPVKILDFNMPIAPQIYITRTDG